jgi:hypothetical protein
VTTPAPDRSRAWASAAAGLVLLLLVVGVVWQAGDDDAAPSAEPSDEPSALSEARFEGAQAALDGLTSAWADRDQQAFLDAAGDAPQASTWAGRTYEALTLLDAGDLDLRFVGERASGAAVSAPGSVQRFTGDVEVSWELDGYRTSTSTVALSFGDSQDDVSVLGLAGGASSVGVGAPLPLWLAGELVGEAGSRCLGVDASPDRCERLAQVAEEDLAAVLPADMRDHPWRVVSPATGSMASALLGRGASGLGQVAAVTTTLDASGSRKAPQIVVLNPDVFGGLKPDAAQLVMSHEATHAATGAAAVDMPLWVAEGFADWVALHDGRIPVEQAAARFLETVRREGPPTHLPRDRDFAAGRNRAGEAYEAAWTVLRYIGGQYGDETALGLYSAALRGNPANLVKSSLGIGLDPLLQRWRRDTEALAHLGR